MVKLLCISALVFLICCIQIQHYHERKLIKGIHDYFLYLHILQLNIIKRTLITYYLENLIF